MKTFSACLIMAAILLLPIEVDSASTANLTVQVRAPGTPVSIAPTSASVSDTAGSGQVITAITVTMSSGPFTGTLSLPNNGGGIAALSGSNLVTARTLTSADDGTHSPQVCATQGTQVCQTISLNVSAGGAVPAPAQASGFTARSLHSDFRDGFHTNTANWLDCAMSSGTPEWYRGWVGFGFGLDCSHFQMVNDGGQQVLKLLWDESQLNSNQFTQIETISPSGTS